MDEEAVAAHLHDQAGVVSRTQVLVAGGTDNDIARLVRRRVWARLHEGVYVDHTGPPTWDQRAWSATLVHRRAVLSGRSALVAEGLLADGGEPVEVAVDGRRRVADPAGVRTVRLAHLGDFVHPGSSPPRLRVEHAALLVASRAKRPDAAVAVLADVVQQRRTTPDRLATALGQHPRLPRRALLREVLADVTQGAHSALERRYLRDVERAHALPRATRQLRVEGERVAYRDAAYQSQRVVVELDGRLGHERSADVWADLQRDLEAALDDTLTVRLAWRQALAPCRTASAVGAILTVRGWDGAPRPCGPDCALDSE